MWTMTSPNDDSWNLNQHSTTGVAILRTGKCGSKDYRVFVLFKGQVVEFSGEDAYGRATEWAILVVRG